MTRKRPPTSCCRCLLALIALGCADLPADDIFVLKNGGRIHGRWENPDKGPEESYAITLSAGGRLTLAPSQVRQALPGDPWEQEYQQVAATAEDSVEGQWAVAQWCRQRGLDDRRQVHLRRIIAIEPDHAAARHGLGYSQVRGRWLVREQHMRERGYEQHEGRWRLPQDIQLIDERNKLEQVEKDWYVQLRRWRAMMSTGSAKEAYRSLATLEDPTSVLALRQLLKEEPYRQVKLLYIAALGRIDNQASASILVDVSLSDPDEEIFHAALDQLVRNRPPHIKQRYIGALKDNNNIRLNRAGYALGRLGDRSCISPLVAALVTTHYMVLPSNPNTHTATFVKPAGSGAGGPLGGTGFSSGEPPQVIPWTVRNEEVLQALISLSGGVNFGFDQRAWNAWLANEIRQTSPIIEPRRESD